MMNNLTNIQEQNARNMKDFLELYNRFTERCFYMCVSNFNKHTLNTDEGNCVNVCVDRYVKYNQRLMLTFMEFQNVKQEAAIKELEVAQAEGRAPNLPGMLPMGTVQGSGSLSPPSAAQTNTKPS